MIHSKKVEYFDVVVIGGGPAGAVVATNLAKAGVSVLALERHAFPRYHVGESLTGLAAHYISELGLTEQVEKLHFPRKLGIKFISQNDKNEIFVPVQSPTWHVRRSEFDQLLLEHAAHNGATVRYGSVKKIFRDKYKVIGLGYKPLGSGSDLLNNIRCKIVVDASGHSLLLSRSRIAGRRRADSFCPQIAIFTHFKGALRDPGEMGDNTFIFHASINHWAWFIPLSEDLVSVGLMAPAITVRRSNCTVEDFFNIELEKMSPDLARRVQNSEVVEPLRIVTNSPYRLDPFAGDGWICVGDSHRFIDPVLPLGITLAMTEAMAASKAILTALKTGDCQQPFEEYMEFSNLGQDRAADLTHYFWNFLTLFNAQTRSKLRKDIIRLLDGDFFTPEESTAMTAMRSSLHNLLLPVIPAGRAHNIATRLRLCYSPGIEAAYIKVVEEKIYLSFVLTDDDPDLQEAGSDFEESLYAYFGRENLFITRYTLDQEIPPMQDMYMIFDNRSNKS
jgi:1H-pyrrole-2-carbonyl-[peptidyl-carrier protein] brominase